MTPYEFNRILEYRFEAFIDKYWCFSYDEGEGFLFMYVADNYVGVKKMRKRMNTIASYLLRQFAQVKAVIFPETTYTRKGETVTIKNQSDMNEKKETGNWLPVVKKTVDDVYNYLIQNPDGAPMVAKDYGKRGARICSDLVSRGIIEKKSLGRGHGWKYRWVATMGPTKVLYGSIAQKLYDEDKKYKDEFYKKKRAKAQESEPEEAAVVEQPAPVEQASEPVIEAPVVNDAVTPSEKKKPVPTIDDIQKAWTELIKRYESRPRLTNALRNARLFVMDKTDKVLVFFSVINDALQQWILKNLIFDLQGVLREVLEYDDVMLCPTVTIEPVEKEPVKASAEDFSAQENWDALKKKGATIENNQIIMTEIKVVKTVLS